MAEYGQVYGGIVPVVEPSAWWQTANITLYKGETAWELKEINGVIAEAFMLVGDGKAVNGPAGPYTRLRVSGNNIMVDYEGSQTTIKTALAALIDQITSTTLDQNQKIAEIAWQSSTPVITSPAAGSTYAVAQLADYVRPDGAIVNLAERIPASINGQTTEAVGTVLAAGAAFQGQGTIHPARDPNTPPFGNKHGAITFITHPKFRIAAQWTGKSLSVLYEQSSDLPLERVMCDGSNPNRLCLKFRSEVSISGAVYAQGFHCGMLVNTGASGTGGAGVSTNRTSGVLHDPDYHPSLSAGHINSDTYGPIVSNGDVQSSGKLKGASLDVSGASHLHGTDIAGNVQVSGSAAVDGNISGNAASFNGQITAPSAVVNGNTRSNSATVTGELQAASAVITGAAQAGSVQTPQANIGNLQVAGNASIGGQLNVPNLNIPGKITANKLQVNDRVDGNLAINGGISGSALDISGNASADNVNANNLNASNALTAVLATVGSLTTQNGTALHGITAIDDLRAAIVKNPLGTRIMLQWLSGEITLGNMADRLKLQSLNRPKVADAQGTHEVAYLDDLIGNILFQFSVYSLGESQASLPVINPERPPVLNEKAIVKNWSNRVPAYVKWSGTAWAFDSMVEKPDNYAWEWVVQNHRNHTYEHFATCYAIFSHEELWSIVEVPLEMYRPFAEQDTIDNNAKAWTRYGVNHIPDWISTRVPERITPAMMGVNGIGQNPPAEDRGSVILNKPPLLSDLYALNVIDGGDETTEDFNEAQWGDHAWGFLVDGGHEDMTPVFRFFVDGGNEKYLPFWYDRVYPTVGEAANA
jgi:cytoskeletal protein CcmA (bactofilin family)